MAAAQIKESAEAKDTKLFYKIRYIDLIAKEFKYHDFCYREFTRKVANTNTKQFEDNDAKGNFDKVTDYIQRKVLSQNQVISMTVLHDLYGLHTQDTRYRSKLKNRIVTKFPDQLLFLTIDAKTLQDVISREGTNKNTLLKEREEVIKQAAEYLREDIREYARDSPELQWPPYIEELAAETRPVPSSVRSFLIRLLTDDRYSPSLNAQRLVQSYAADLVHGVTRGNVMTAKHFLIGLGLHSITGKKKPIQLLNLLGHSIDYNNYGIPATEEHAVLTFFWADNFDMNLETQTGHGAINSTHMIAFQEQSQFTMERSTSKVKFARTGKRSIAQSHMEGEEMQVNPKKEPPILLIIQLMK
ncbi:Hypothetical predicted protein [Paramuricea clavata]|uniref:Uncharacterized protein n=1 Tax=Paramuricea clavata TaxID=317549 RepID=A0A6S7IH52_PARCT|nr:Hypothetical predicted protein [Paramuricea clavata]